MRLTWLLGYNLNLMHWILNPNFISCRQVLPTSIPVCLINYAGMLVHWLFGLLILQCRIVQCLWLTFWFISIVMVWFISIVMVRFSVLASSSAVDFLYLGFDSFSIFIWSRDARCFYLVSIMSSYVHDFVGNLFVKYFPSIQHPPFCPFRSFFPIMPSLSPLTAFP